MEILLKDMVDTRFSTWAPCEDPQDKMRSEPIRKEILRNLGTIKVVMMIQVMEMEYKIILMN